LACSSARFGPSRRHPNISCEFHLVSEFLARRSLRAAGSTRGVNTAKTDVDLIERRLKAAKTEYEAQYGPVKQKR
jgi:hypothetical protein